MTHTGQHAYFAAVDTAQMRAVFTERLPRHLGAPTKVVDLAIPRVVPRGRGGFAIQYNINLDNPDPLRHELILYGHLLGPDEKYPPYIMNNNANIIAIDEFRMVIPVFPFDPELPHLPSLFSEASVVPLLRQCLADERDASISLKNISVLGYRLGRRCVIAYDVIIDGGRQRRFAAKLVKDAGKHNLWQNLGILEHYGFDADAEDRLTVPHQFHIDPATETCFMEYVDGVSLYDLFDSADFVAGAAAAGKILRKLHDLAAEVSDSYSTADELQNLVKFAVAGEIFPEWDEKLTIALERLEGEALELDSDYDPALSHRDFYDKQVLYTQERVTLLDCEGLTMADPALDFANFLAHLKLRALQQPAHSSMLQAAANTFAQCYGIRDPYFGKRTRWWMASSLTRLGCLYALRPRWTTIAPFLIDHALDVLDGKKINIGGANSV